MLITCDLKLQLLVDEVDCGVNDNNVALQSDVRESDQDELEQLEANRCISPQSGCMIMYSSRQHIPVCKEIWLFLKFTREHTNLGRG
jgi:hypothetical protein